MQEDVAVDEIESIALWRVGLPFPAEDRREWTFLAVEVGHIAIEMSLLQQVRAAGKIIDPRPGLFSPSLVAIEPEPVGSKRQAGRHVGQRLMGRLMNFKAVDAQREFEIGDFLERVGREGPRRSVRGHGLSAHKVLPVNVRDGRSSAQIGQVRRIGTGPARPRPHGSHGNVGLGAHFHVVAERGTMILECFAVVTHPTLV